MNARIENFNEHVSYLYPKTLKIAADRLGVAPNLCGLRTFTAVDANITADVLVLALDGGWRHGILGVLSDVAMFLGHSQEFKDRFGDYPIAGISARLSDAIMREDHRSIHAAVKALEPDRFRDRVDGGTWFKGKGSELVPGSLFQFVENPGHNLYGQTFSAIEIESGGILTLLLIEDSTGHTANSSVRPDEPIWILSES